MSTLEEYDANRSLLDEIETRFRAGKQKEAQYLFDHLTSDPSQLGYDRCSSAYMKTQYENLKQLLFAMR